MGAEQGTLASSARLRHKVGPRRCVWVFGLGIGLAVVPPLYADVVRITISSRTPIFNGQSFGSVGPYEDITGVAFGEIDPRDPRNAVITDIERAPRNARGLVEYRTTFTLRKPVDMTRSAGVLLYNIVNRGNHGGPSALKGRERSLAGGYVPFAKTRAARLAAGDPRRSIEERYPSLWSYYASATTQADALVTQRFLLPEDAVRLLKALLSDVEASRLFEKSVIEPITGRPDQKPARAALPSRD